LIVSSLEACLRAQKVLMDESRIDDIAPFFTSQIPGGNRQDWINELKEDLPTFNPGFGLEEAAFANAVHFEQEFGLLPPGYDFNKALEQWPLDQAMGRIESMNS